MVIFSFSSHKIGLIHYALPCWIVIMRGGMVWQGGGECKGTGSVSVGGSVWHVRYQPERDAIGTHVADAADSTDQWRHSSRVIGLQQPYQCPDWPGSVCQLISVQNCCCLWLWLRKWDFSQQLMVAMYQVLWLWQWFNFLYCLLHILPLVLWHCWFGFRKSIWTVKIEWWRVHVVISLDWGADSVCLQVIRPVPLSFINPTISCLIEVPSVLWRCWLGGRKGIRPVKNRVVGYWHGYLSGARCRLAYGSADATATYCLLLQ